MSSDAHIKHDKNDKFSWWDLFRTLWYFLKGERTQFVFWVFTLFAVFFYFLVPPFIVGKIIDFFTHYHKGDSLGIFYIYVAILGISHILVSLVRLTSKNKVADLGVQMSYNARIEGFERLLDFTLAWHDKENTGNKVQRIQNGTAAIVSMLQCMTHTGFQTIAQIVGVIAIFIFLDPLFSLLSLVYFVVFTAINVGFYKKMLQIRDDANRAQEAASGTYYEGLNNVLTIKTLGVKDTFKQSVNSRERLTKAFNHKAISIGTGKWKIFQVVNGLCLVIYLLMMGHGLVTGLITVGAIFVYYTYISKLLEAAGDSTGIFEELISYKATIARMMPIYWQKIEIKEGNLSFPKDWKQIVIENGNFAYAISEGAGANLFAIKDLNLVIKRNEKIGVVGHSGGGKSTLAKLLLGLYELEKGEFRVDGVSFYDMRHNEITQHIATVLQESEMFNFSLRENITLMRDIRPELFEKAIKISQLESVVKKLPEGLETLIGEKGYRLSGGERQRIGIARAICKDPEILVLDEATSALDSKTESLIQEALEKDLEKKTVISIAHRISTLKHVDRIIVFDKGSMIEEGGFEELLKNPKSKFYEVYQMQSKASGIGRSR